MKTYDYIIVGAGIIGLTLAYELRKKYPLSKICILEKEVDVAKHASGRNSGILHAGFYYTDNSLKARFCVQGNVAMKAFCQSHAIPVAHDGKLVVATTLDDVATLSTLHSRGLKNGVDVRLIDEKEARDIEPGVKTVQKALYSPNTAAVNPVKVCQRLKEILVEKHVQIKTDCKVSGIKGDQVIVQKETFYFKKLINCAGMFADKIAHMCDVGHEFTMIPFKGLYLKYQGERTLRTNIYPVPNLLNPFLGVHFTKTAEGNIKIGPTAIPAFWREHYKGLNHFNVKEMIEIISLESSMFLHNYSRFRSIAKQEFPKYWKPYLINEALKLADFDSKNYQVSLPGIRAQLFNKQTKQLEMDFIIKSTQHSIHVLNAVSPAFTCSFALAEYVVGLIDGGE